MFPQFNHPLSAMKQARCIRRVLQIIAPLAAAVTACLLLGACASTTSAPPPPGSAVIDPEYRAHVEGIKLVSINGRSVNGTRSAIRPGLNAVRTRFRWPHGRVQEADLRFYATPGTVYYVHYDVFPPYDKFKSRVGGRMVDSVGNSGDPYAALGAVLVGPAAAVIGIGERVVHNTNQRGQAATYMDLMLVAHHSSQGIVRRVRAYPDGRVDAKPWAAGAQIQAP